MRSSILVATVVIIHHAIAFLHGGAHDDLAIPMAAWQTGFINLVIILLPLVGIGLLFSRLRRYGLYAVIAGMSGALVFGIVHHYMLVSPDHISHLPAAEAHVHATFSWTAGTIAMLEGVAAALAAYCLGAQRSK